MKSIIFFTSGLVGVSAEPVEAREDVCSRLCSSNRACRSSSQCLNGNCEGIYVNDSDLLFHPTQVESGSIPLSCSEAHNRVRPHPRHQLNRYDNLLSLLSYGVSLVDGIQSGRDAARAAIVDVPVQAPAPGTTQRSGLSRVRLANILFAGVNVLSKLWKGNRSRALIDLVASLGIFGGSKVAAKSWWSDFGREFGLKKTFNAGTAAGKINERFPRLGFGFPVNENVRYRGDVALMQHIRRVD